MKNHNYLICLVFIIFLALFSTYAFAAPGVIRTAPNTTVNGSTITVSLSITAASSYSLDDSAPVGWVITSSSTSECQFSTNKIRCINTDLTGGLQTRTITYNVVVNNTINSNVFSGTYSIDGVSGPITDSSGTPTNNPPSAPTLTAPSSGLVNAFYNFTATSTDPESNQIKYEWDWNGDGVVDESSILLASGVFDLRSHNFTTAGTYNIKVRAVDSSGSASSFAQSSIAITSPLSVNIGGPYSAQVNSQIQFTGTIGGGNNPITFNWNFGDGSTSTQQNPLHAYSAAGTYTVSLAVTDSSGTITKSTTATITAPTPTNNPPLAPALSGSSSGLINILYSFTATSTDPESNQIKYEWDWNGDGVFDESSNLLNSGTTDNRNHTFVSAGTYNIRVRAIDSLGLTSTTSQINIVISQPSPLSISIGGPYSGTVGAAVQFSSQVSGGSGNYVYLWNFGDGSTSTQQNSPHSYTSTGTYTVQLTVSDSLNSVVKTATVSITAAVVTTTNLTGNVTRIIPSSVAAGSVVTIALNVDIGNGTAFALEEYPPSGWRLLSVENKLGCTLVPVQNPVSIGCVVLNNPSSTAIYYNISVPSSAAIGSTYNFTGNFGIKKSATEDTVLRTTGGNLSTTIGSVADFTLSSQLISSEIIKGSSSAFQITTTSINGYNSQISMSTLSLPSGVSISFNPQSGVQTFISTATISVSSSAQSGTYPMTMRATGVDGKTKDIIYTLTVKEPVITQPLLASAGGPYSTIINIPLQFTSSVSGGTAPYTYNWTFGDGITSAQQNPLYIYNNIGNYTVSLTVKDSSGLSIANSTTASVTPATQSKFTLVVDTNPVKGNIILNGTSQGPGPVTLLLTQGYYNISYSSITGYTSPANETIYLTQNQTLNRTYVAGVIASCGDGSCNGGETTASCPTDCGSSQCISNIEFKDSENLNISATCMSANTISSWNINDPLTFPVTAFSVNPKVSLPYSKISIKKIATAYSIGLSNPYQYFNITSSINDSAINSVIISFVVRNTWISSNKINNDTISLYRYTSSWDKIPTTRVKNDSTYTYYQATIQGFGLYATDGQKADCPVCNQPTAWSSCINSVQTRTNYICNDPVVGCVPAQESTACCPTCQTNAESTCTGGVITKKAYRCGPDTNFVCSESVSTSSCITSQDAQTAINNAITTIESADKDNKNTTTAKDLLVRSQAAFAIGDFQNARQLASDAEASAKAAPIIAQPFFLPIPFEFLIMAIVAAAAAGSGILIWKKRSGASLCTVCAKPTAMKFLCNTCNGHVCFKDSKIYQGKVYCSNCLKRLGMQQPPRQ